MVDAGPSLRLHEISDRAVAMTRQFGARREIVFQAMTEADHIEGWWGPRGHQATVVELDFRVGGRWRFVTVNGEGREHPFTGVFREIAPPRRVVQTFTFDAGPFAAAQSIETMTLEDLGDITTMTTVARYSSPELLDVMLEWGMEKGLAESYERLEEYLKTLT